MGRKQRRARQLVCFFIAGLVLFSLWSCSFLKKQFIIEAGLPTANAGTQNEPRKPEGKGLQKAKSFFLRGDYESAIEENQKVFSLTGKNPPGDQALYNMALIYAHFANPKKDYEKSILLLKKLSNDFPRSPLVEETKIWAEVLQENGKLLQVIEKYKEVDIAVEEKKREIEK